MAGWNRRNVVFLFFWPDLGFFGMGLFFLLAGYWRTGFFLFGQIGFLSRVVLVDMFFVFLFITGWVLGDTRRVGVMKEGTARLPGIDVGGAV